MKPRLLMLLLGLGLQGSGVRAADFDWAGYGSLSTYRVEADGVRVRPDPQAAHFARPGEWRWDGDSRLGLQGRWRNDAGSEWVAQTELSDQEQDRWRPRLAWAYWSWAPAPGLQLRLGRQTLPTMRLSETRTVGFSQPWVRAPLPVYDLNPTTPVDGVNASWERPWAEGSLRLDLGGGRGRLRLNGRRIELRQSLNSTLQWQGGPWTLGLSASHARFDLDGNPLQALAASGLCSNCASLMQTQARSRGIRTELLTVLLAWETPRWQIGLEALNRPRSNSLLSGRAWGWLASASLRIGAWQAHLGLGENRSQGRLAGLQAVAGAPAAVQAQLDAIDRALQNPIDLRSLQAGLRWDLAEGLALKWQIERRQALRDRTTGRRTTVLLATPPLGSEPANWNGVVRLNTLSLDFAF